MSGELLAIGQTCSHPACSLVDFLPIKCQHCTKPYCSDHWKPDVHTCPKYNANTYNRVAPACPFCQKPVAFAAGVDPNIAMENHFENFCEVTKGGSLVGFQGRAVKEDESPRCSRKTCRKVLITPIKCQTCYQQFCAEHRFPTNHACKTGSAPVSNTPSGSSSRATTPATNPNASAARANAALAAMNRAATASKQRATPSLTKPSSKAPAPPNIAATPSSSKSKTIASTSSHTVTNPFSKTERWDTSTSSATNAHFKPSASSSSSSSPLPLASGFGSTSISSSASQSSTTITNTSASNDTSSTPVASKPTAVIPQSFIPPSLFGMA